MPTDSLQTVTDTLRSENDRLSQQAADLKQQLKTVTDEQRRIQAALTALSGKQTTKQFKRQAATTTDVAAAIAHVLEREAELEETDLKTKVQQRLTTMGLSRTGFALRFTQALKDEHFEPIAKDDECYYRLAIAATAK